MEINRQRLEDLLGNKIKELHCCSPYNILLNIIHAERILEIPVVQMEFSLLGLTVADEYFKNLWAVKYYLGSGATVVNFDDLERHYHEKKQLKELGLEDEYKDRHGISIANHYELISYRVEPTKRELNNLNAWTKEELDIYLDIVSFKDLNRKNVLNNKKYCIQCLLEKDKETIQNFKLLSNDEKRKKLTSFIKFKRL